MSWASPNQLAAYKESLKKKPQDNFLTGIFDALGGGMKNIENMLLPRPQIRAAAPPIPLTPTPTPDPNAVLSEAIKQGFLRYGPNTPAATLSGQFARAGQGLPDPYMPAVLALKETSGGKNMTHDNNLLNILFQGGMGNSGYENPQDGIVGGDGHRGFPGVIHSGAYDNYLKSGNLREFFQHYTPYSPGGSNPPYDQQIQQYNQLRSYFTNK